MKKNNTVAGISGNQISSFRSTVADLNVSCNDIGPIDPEAVGSVSKIYRPRYVCSDIVTQKFHSVRRIPAKIDSMVQAS